MEFQTVHRKDLQVKLYKQLTGSTTAGLLFPQKTLAWESNSLEWRHQWQGYLNIKMISSTIPAGSFRRKKVIWFGMSLVAGGQILNLKTKQVIVCKTAFQRQLVFRKQRKLRCLSRERLFFLKVHNIEAHARIFCGSHETCPIIWIGQPATEIQC